MNNIDNYYKAAYQSGAAERDLATESARQVKRPTKVNETTAKDDKNRFNSSTNYTEEERKYLEALKRRDREVRTHEMAHKSAGGRYVGAISYIYQIGPDHKQYAIGGKTKIDTSELPEPEENIEKQEIVKKAAMAPNKPSNEDKKVASEAQQSIYESKIDIQVEDQKEMREERHSVQDETTQHISIVA